MSTHLKVMLCAFSFKMTSDHLQLLYYVGMLRPEDDKPPEQGATSGGLILATDIQAKTYFSVYCSLLTVRLETYQEGTGLQRSMCPLHKVIKEGRQSVISSHQSGVSFFTNNSLR